MLSLVYLLKQPRANVTGSDIFATSFSFVALCNLPLKMHVFVLNTNNK